MSKLKKISLVFLIASLTANCAVYHSKPISSSDKATAFEARTLDDPAVKKFIEASLHLEIRPWPPESWDFTLLSLAALYYHPDLAVARTEAESAEASVIAAGSRPNPSVSITPQFSANPPSGVSPWFLITGLEIPIETAHKRGYRLNRAKYLAQAARFEMAATAWRIRNGLRNAMLSFSFAKEEVALLEQETNESAEVVLMFKQRMAAGEVSADELNTAEIFLARARLQLRNALGVRADAMADLASAVGLPVSTLKEVNISTVAVEQLPSPATLSRLDLRRRALLNRPDILASLAVYEAAESTLQLEIAKQYPDVTLLPGYTWDQGQNEWAFGVTISLPIFNRNEGPIAEAEARRAQAEARFVALQARVIGDIDRATADFETALQGLALADNLLAMEKNRYLSAQAMYDAGEADREILLKARLDHLGAGLSRLGAFRDANKAFSMLEQALYCPLLPHPPITVQAPAVRENPGTIQ